MRALSVLLIVLSPFPLFAQSLDAYERVLIPAFATPAVTGLGGSRFAARLFAYGDGVRYFPRYRYVNGVLVAEEATFDQGRGAPLFAPAPPSRAGRVLFVERARAGELFLQASLASQPPGNSIQQVVRLPIVREQDFRSETIQLFDIASEYVYEGISCRIATPRYRHALRVYAADERGGSVRVRLFDELLASRFLEEFTLDVASREGADPTYPVFGEATLPEICNPFSCHSPCFGGLLRVEITPLTPGLRVWAIVSATENTTLEIELFYPE